MIKFNFQNILFMLYDKVEFLRWLLCTLCEIEMSFKLMLSKEFREELEVSSVINPNTRTCRWQEIIPKDTQYCHDCYYRDGSLLARIFFGSQSCGYCYHLGKGDFSYINPTMLIWDGCKECGYSYFKGDE